MAEIKYGTITSTKVPVFAASNNDWGAGGSGLATTQSKLNPSGKAYDNTATKFTHALFKLKTTFSSNPTSGSTVELWAVPTIDSDQLTVSEGASPVTPGGAWLLGTFPLVVQTASQVRAFIAPLPPCNMRFLAVNQASGQTIPDTATVDMFPFDYQVA